MEPLLDPKNDVVFKLLLVRYPHVLVQLLNAVLCPPSPIVSATVLNPDLPKSVVDDKGAVLDVAVRLSDGSTVDVEMQMSVASSLTARLLYYWARLYTSSLAAGQPHDDLVPCHCVTFLGENLWPTSRYHSVFQVLERHDHHVFSDHLALHTLELAKLAEVMKTAEERASADIDWGRFFAAASEQELEDLVMQRPEMNKPVEALRELSEDAKARFAAMDRDRAQKAYLFTLNAARKEARAEGEAAGRAEGVAVGRAEGVAVGRAEATARAVLTVLASRGITISEAQRERVLATREDKVLDEWLRRAATVYTTEALFEP